MMGETVAEWPLCMRILLSPFLLLWFGARVYMLPCIGIAFQRMLRCCCRGFLRHVCCGCGLTFTDSVGCLPSTWSGLELFIFEYWCVFSDSVDSCPAFGSGARDEREAAVLNLDLLMQIVPERGCGRQR